MKKILITGGRGFVGKHLVKKLSDLDYKVFTTDLPEIDLKKKTQVNELLFAFNPDVIIHLAAKVGGIGANQKNPGVFMRDNLEMGLNIINSALSYCIKKFIMIGTVCAYPKYTPVPFKESDLWNGYPEETNAPYGIAKKTLMELIIAYNKQFQFNGVNLIPVNMYGPGDNFNPVFSHVIPALILKVYKAIVNKEDKIVVWGTGQASREFLYVDDFVNSIVLAVEKEPGPQPINIGTGQEIKICELINMICIKMGFTGDIIYDSRKPDGQPRRCLDITRAQEVLGYSPTIDFNTGLDKTIEWFFKNTDKMNDYLNYIQ